MVPRQSLSALRYDDDDDDDGRRYQGRSFIMGLGPRKHSVVLLGYLSYC